MKLNRNIEHRPLSVEKELALVSLLSTVNIPMKILAQTPTAIFPKERDERTVDFIREDLTRRVNFALEKHSQNDTSLDIVVEREKLPGGVTEVVTWTDQSGPFPERVRIATMRERGQEIPFYMEVEITPIGYKNPQEIRKYNLARGI